MSDRPCDVCKQPLSRHQRGAGVPICPGIYAPSYRSTLHEQIDTLLADIARLQAERDYLKVAAPDAYTMLECRRAEIECVRAALSSTANGGES